MRSHKLRRRLPIGALVELVDIALRHGEGVAGAGIVDLRAELVRREHEVGVVS